MHVDHYILGVAYAMEKENASLHADQKRSASSGNMSTEVMSKIMFVLVCLVSRCMFCVDLVDLCPPRQGQRMCFEWAVT